MKMLQTDLLKRLSYQAHHRSMKEADLILGRFAEACLPHLTEKECEQFSFLLLQDDGDILDWLFERQSPPSLLNTSLFTRLKKWISC